MFPGAVPDTLDSAELIVTIAIDKRLFPYILPAIPSAGAIKPHQKIDCQVIS
jgi:hypothetical protein